VWQYTQAASLPLHQDAACAGLVQACNSTAAQAGTRALHQDAARTGITAVQQYNSTAAQAGSPPLHEDAVPSFLHEINGADSKLEAPPVVGIEQHVEVYILPRAVACSVLCCTGRTACQTTGGCPSSVLMAS
jgi:hypothetical protein